MPKITRRTFLWLTGGSSIALATDPQRKFVNKLIPQVIPPENIKPGEWHFFATTCRECPAGCGMQLWHRDGRVTKAEGNPAHPVNRGTLCARGQSALQGHYDPDRVQSVLYRGAKGRQNRSWEEALSAIGSRLTAHGRVAVVSSLQTGALAEVMKDFAGAFGPERLIFYEAFDYEPLKEAHRMVFGAPVVPSYRIEQCDLVLSFAADFLETWISPVSYATQFGTMHSYQGGGRLGRLAYVGPRLSMTAANADDFLQVHPGQERVVAAALLKIILDRGWEKNDIGPARKGIDALVTSAGPIPGVDPRRLEQLARAFTSAGSSVALAGPVGARGGVATETAVLCALLNHAAGRIGREVDLARPHALTDAASEKNLQRFLASLGPDDVLLIHDANIAYTRPEAAAALGRAGTVVYLGTLIDETAQRAHWILPIDSHLESWGEYEPETGVHGLMQPTMGRLYDTRAAGDILLELARRGGLPIARSSKGPAPADFQGWLRQRWDELGAQLAPTLPRETFWMEALRKGGVFPSPSPTSAPQHASAAPVFTPPTPPPPLKSAQAELWLWPTIMIFDGRLANRGWMQEAPDPMTFITWGNWIDMHQSKAAALGLEEGDEAEIATATGSVRAPVRISREISENAVALAVGYGHHAMGAVAKGVGVNAFTLFGGAPAGSTFGTCRVRRVSSGGTDNPVSTSLTRLQFDRHIVQWVPLSKLSRMRSGEGDKLTLPLPEGYRPDQDLYPKREYTKHRWAMVIDLQRCIGCGACAVACYAENNIAVIGREKVGNGREMAWLRVAPYREPGKELRFGWLPLLCQHCDAAPCEPVCPVFAAMHNEEGLNAQIYNRCIGTRYCSNNCPYKVRRFNWLNVDWRKPLDLQLNPEVTVRCRGVMEKCTFCVQRIRHAEYRALLEGRAIADGEIQPACAQTCPTRAFTFGDLLDPNARVTKLTRSDPRRYHVLEELNTKPAVTFLRRVQPDTEII